jgi:16S rRNA (cytosine967-C5)-methyltransferase
MSRYYSYLNTSKQVLQLYDGAQPFSSFLKNFFSTQKKYGSRDRKMISHLCYCYFRLGKSLLDVPVEERILAALFLCSDQSNEILAQLKPSWNAAMQLPFGDKSSLLSEWLSLEFSSLDVFPWTKDLSDSIDHQQFCQSFFVQPDLFLRLRPGKEGVVKQKLKEKGIVFQEVSSSCLSLPTTTKLEEIVELDKEAIVQDLSSQSIGELYSYPIAHSRQEINAWDCCAGSGGKSILLHDLDPSMDLTVSDVRPSILINLKKRFEKAGIKNYRSFATDGLSNGQPCAAGYDLIIADVPCTGSGTWSRTPEQLYFFDKEKIDQYQALQKKIVSSIIPHIKPNGFLTYSTCSVFKKENEEMVEYIKNEFPLELIEMKFFKGYDKKADTLFAALFKRS